jgi:hypothetical protein
VNEGKAATTAVVAALLLWRGRRCNAIAATAEVDRHQRFFIQIPIDGLRAQNAAKDFVNRLQCDKKYLRIVAAEA